jgi:putative peptidoglycan lipid II flippase
MVALAGLAALGAVLARAHNASPSHHSSSLAQQANQALPIAGAISYNPEGTGQEDPGDLRNLYDGNPATVWSTQWYATPHFGNLKNGTGFVLGLGRVREVSRVVVDTTTPGWTAQVYVARQVGAQVTDWGRPVASGTASSTLSLSWPKQEGSYVLVWFTELGPAQQAIIGEATLYS